jgi:hypothetical protein
MQEKRYQYGKHLTGGIMHTIEKVFDLLADVDIDAELVEVFDDSIWIKVTNVETEQNDDDDK